MYGAGRGLGYTGIGFLDSKTPLFRWVLWVQNGQSQDPGFAAEGCGSFGRHRVVVYVWFCCSDLQLCFVRGRGNQ